MLEIKKKIIFAENLGKKKNILIVSLFHFIY